MSGLSLVEFKLRDDSRHATIAQSLASVASGGTVLRAKDMDDPRNGWYTIHPIDAAGHIGSTALRNRSVRALVVDEMARDMRCNGWVKTGEPVVFDGDGRLADGQHRMRACIKSGEAFTTFVVYIPSSLGPSFFDELNQGTKRNASDRISLLGGKNTYLAAAVCRRLINYTNCVADGVGRISPRDVRIVWEESGEEVASAIEAVRKSVKQPFTLIPSSVMVHGFLQARRVDEEKSREWMYGIATGANLPPGSPMLLLRGLLNSTSAGVKSYTDKALSALLAKSWIMFRHGIIGRALVYKSTENVPRYNDALKAKRPGADLSGSEGRGAGRNGAVRQERMGEDRSGAARQEWKGVDGIGPEG